uniref:Uncharacterized protein n=1 Tax=Solanum lycopersicum TaxID=4081 RepID=A0A3Q7I194_SOLLC
MLAIDLFFSLMSARVPLVLNFSTMLISHKVYNLLFSRLIGLMFMSLGINPRYTSLDLKVASPCK